MKSGWPLWLFIGLLVVLHFVLHLSFGFGRGAPDLLVVAVLLGARALPAGGAAALGFALGLLQDAVSLSAFGAGAATHTIIGYLGARSRDLFVGDSVLFLAVYLFLGAWVQDALYYGLAASIRRGGVVEALLVQAPVAAAYAALAGTVAVLIYRTLRR